MFSNMSILVFAVIIDMMETRTIKEQLKLKLCKNLRTNEPRPKFTGSYKRKVCILHRLLKLVCSHMNG